MFGNNFRETTIGVHTCSELNNHFLHALINLQTITWMSNIPNSTVITTTTCMIQQQEGVCSLLIGLTKLK